MVITIHEDGTIEHIAGELDLSAAGVATKTRASHVLPCLWPVRRLFQLLRWATGETGAVSNWTRRWPSCVTWGWSVEIVDGPHLGTFWDRDEAIAAEVAWLEQNRL